MAYPQGYFTGSFLARWTTGVMAAALAADAVIAAIRNGPTQSLVAAVGNVPNQTTKAYIMGLQLKLSGTVGFTAVQQFGFYLQRFSTANMAGGAAADILNLSENYAASNPSVCKTGGTQAGDTRVATTAALTSAGVVFDAAKVPVYGWSSVGPGEYVTKLYDFSGNPIRLDVGEGLALVNQIVWPAAGTAIVEGQITWSEGLL